VKSFTGAGVAATIRALHTAVKSLQREDVVNALLTLTPLYRYVSKDNNNDPYRDVVLQGHQAHSRQRPVSSSVV